jgi:DNA-binding IclR family transcriptional regulator
MGRSTSSGVGVTEPTRGSPGTRGPAARTPGGNTSGDLRSVGIALDIIDALAETPELGVSEVARRVGIAKSTAHRTCAVLAARGLLDRTDEGGYRLGLRFVEYGGLATERTAVRDRGLPLLVELRNTLGETVQIGVPAGADVVYVERVEGRRALRYSTNARRSPIHRSSAGKALAAFNPAMVEARLRAGLPPSTGYTIVVPELLLEELERVRRRGYARSVDETEIGMSSLAVPVHVPLDGPVVAAISMIGPTARLIGDHEPHHTSVLLAGARKLGESIERGEYSLRRRRP